ncbi:hypothetical protein [Parendozoicomonas haliclonae]|uniref:Uncharacterized protein n=1 Tax=Parendozoicomonas haliclonae TaxID=1960125 RepID=A0A1X7AKZ7_9GAMM|nr:hypothetical protein [Parendozoicomonas haliclonae]SMA45129.1 hypothetical protein EHSB41UT_01849 [Parendozoicomonas haliclonae]
MNLQQELATVYDALNNADASGDTEGAQQLADYALQLEQMAQQQSAQAQTQQQPQIQPGQPLAQFGQQLPHSLQPAYPTQVQTLQHTDPYGREALFDNMVNDMSTTERVLVGAGKAFSDMGSGVKQLGLMAGESLGWVEPGAVEEHRKMLAAEDAMYQELTDRSTAATVGNIGTNILTFAVPGGAIAKGANVAKMSTAGRLGFGALYGAGETAAFTPVLSEDFIEGKAKQAGMGALFGIGGELAGNLVNSAVKRFTKAKHATPQALDKFLEENGINPAELPDDYRQAMRTEINRRLGSGVDDTDTALTAIQDVSRSRGGDFVPITPAERKGILDSDYSDWALQKEAEMGVYGPEAQQQAAGFEKMRDGILAESVTDQFSRLGPLDEVTDLQAPATRFTQGIESAVDTAKQNKTAAYQAVDEAGLMAEPSVYREALQTIRGGFGGKIKLASQAETPNAYSLYKEVENLMSGQGALAQADELPGALPPVGERYHSLTDFESLRRRLSAAISSSDKQDKALLSQVKRAYDGWLDDAIDNGRFVGDEANYSALKEARAANREYMSIVEGTYKDGKQTLRTKLVQDIVNGKATPEGVVDQLMGATGTKKNARAINDLKQLLGEESEEFGALKQAGYLNIFGKALDLTDEGIQLKRGNYARSILDKVKANRTTLEALYGKNEIERWTKFANNLRRIQPDQKTFNASGTSYSNRRISNTVNRQVAEFLLDRITNVPMLGTLAAGALDSMSTAGRNRSVYRSMQTKGALSADFTTSKEVADWIDALTKSAGRESLRQPTR